MKVLKQNLIHKIIRFLFFIFFISGSLSAQVLKGTISSSDGETIPFASIYIKQLTTGTTSNLNGEYSIQLGPGDYDVVFQALGYNRIVEKIHVEQDDIVKNIILPKQQYKIQEVRVYSGKEDPAYGIMRKAISLAPYFLRQVKHYKSNVYLKGGFDMNKVPGLFRKQLKDEGIEEGKTYAAESINEITFDSPNKFTHRQISKRSTIPNDSEDQVLGFINYSFYDSDSEMAISPLSRKAFSFYKFRYEGFFEQGDYFVNKIKVTPKRKNQKLFEGYIYIIDQLWNLQSVELTNEQFFGKIKVNQVLDQVKGNAWLPVSHHFDVDVNTMGFKVTANYGGSVKYEEVELDDELAVPQSLQAAYIKVEEDKEIEEEVLAEQQSKEQKQIEELMKKDDLSNREMLKLSRMIEKENKEKEREGKGLKLDSWEDNYTIIRDTVPADSIDWNKVRPIPLSKKEIESFGIKDSLTLALSGVDADSVEYQKERTKTGLLVAKLMGGWKYYLCDSALSVRHQGFLTPNTFNFDPVDGWQYVQYLSMRCNLKEGKQRLDLRTYLKYGFASNQFLWKINSNYNFNFMTHTSLGVSGGQWSTDFNEEYSIHPFVNALSSLFFMENYTRLYKKDFVSLHGRTDIANGLVFSASATYKNAKQLFNQTDFAFVDSDKDYHMNNDIEHVTDFSIFESRKNFTIESYLEYTPKYFYRVHNGRKRMVESDYPTFRLTYKQGLENVLNSTSKFSMAELKIKQDLDWNYLYSLKYMVRAGYYFDNSVIHFSDFTHFKTRQVPVSITEFYHSFALLNDYSYSTNQWYINGSLFYASPYILIKNIPFLQDKLWNENLYFSYLHQPEFTNYGEIGYGVSQIFMMINVAAFVGVKDFEYDRWGIHINFNFGM